MTAINCCNCNTRYVPSPRAVTRYEKSCPECRDMERHTQAETSLLVDLASDAMDVAADVIDSIPDSWVD